MYAIYSAVAFVTIANTVTEAVDCGTPTPQLSYYQACSELASFHYPYPTTVGAFVKFSCESLLIRTRAPEDYCPLMVCQPNGLWTAAKLTCGGATECYDAGKPYEGRRICTKTGKMCQDWALQNVYSEGPNFNISESANRCRDPGEVKGEPWCYTTEGGGLWDTCDIPRCSSIQIGQGMCINDYCGDPDITISTDNACLKVYIDSDMSRYVGSFMTYKCDGLLDGFTSLIDYCPVKTCQSDTYWTTAKVSCGVNECYTNGLSNMYQGRRTCSFTGKICQRWDSHGYTNAALFPDNSVAAAGSYCRDPGATNGQPWCYIDTDVTEICEIPECSTQEVNTGSCTVPVTVPPAGTTVSTIQTTPTSIPTSTPTSTPTPVIGGEERFNHYRKQTTNHSGFKLQTTILNVKSATICGFMCSEHFNCLFFTYEPTVNCNLYKQDELSTAVIPCSTMKCYKHYSLL